jgi:cyclic pyranopterin phosphate synthase
LPECNLNCFYCRPGVAAKKKHSQVPVTKFAQAIEFLHQSGIRKVRFTGGEPTLYKCLPELIALTKKLDSSVFMAITSNGRLLKKLAPALAEAGLDSINISLDTRDREKFRTITSIDAFDQVNDGIKEAIKFIPAVKLNCVLIKGVNDDEAESLIRYANDLGIDIRFIEYMPTRYRNRDQRGYLSTDVLRSRLPYELYPVEAESSSAATYYRSPDFGIRVGFISPISHSFCSACNRIRLASDGTLYGCLFSPRGINLFNLLENEPSTLNREIRNLMSTKPKQGCSFSAQNRNNLPSFYFMGG